MASKKKQKTTAPQPEVPRVTEADYMQARLREFREGEYWRTYRLVLQCIADKLLSRRVDDLDIDLERASEAAHAVAERTHGLLTSIRTL